MSYPDKSMIVDILLDVAKQAAYADATNRHPEDIVAAMLSSLDGAARALVAIHDRETKENPVYTINDPDGSLEMDKLPKGLIADEI